MVRSKFEKGDDRCVCCGESTKTLEHMFFFCEQAEQIWKAPPIQWNDLNEFRNNFWLWWNGIMKAKSRTEGLDHMALTINILWQIWKSRNQMQFQGERKCPGKTNEKAVKEWLEYSEICSKDKGTEMSAKDQVKGRNEGTRPPKGFTCVNTDAALDIQKGRASWGAVDRNENGDLVGDWAGSVERSSEPIVEKANAIRNALRKPMQRGWRRIIIQFDCKNLLEKLVEENNGDPMIGALLENISNLSKEFSSCQVSFIRRDENVVSQKLAKFATTLIGDLDWKESFLA